jgi:hypothetical protein|tara:strand:+ start:61 stop:3924 length:3864 start_codon:yes stop_codon:yes gene_type:complete
MKIQIKKMKKAVRIQKMKREKIMKIQATRINKMFFTSLLILSLGYSGTVTFNSDVQVDNLTIETGDKIVVATGNKVTVNGALNVNGTGELEIATGSTVDVTGNVSIAGTLDMDGTARLMTEGDLAFSSADLEDADGNGIYLDGGATQTVSGDLSSGKFDNLICSSGATVFNLTAAIEDSLDTGGENFTVSTGKTLTMNAGSVTKVSGGTWDLTGATLTLDAASKFLYDTGSNTTLTGPAVTYGILQHDGGELTLGGALHVAGTFTNTSGNLVAGQAITAGGIEWTDDAFTGSAPTQAWAIGAGGLQIDGGTFKNTTGSFTIEGNWTQNGGTLNATTSIVNFTGAAVQTIKSSGAVFYSVSIVNTANPVSLEDDFEFNSSGTLTIDANATFATAGFAFDDNGGTITNNGEFEIHGDESFTTAAISIGGDTKIVSNGSTTTLTTTIGGLENVEFDAAGQIIQFGESMAYITGNITVTAGTVVKMKGFDLTLQNRKTLTNNGTWFAPETGSTFICEGNATLAGEDMNFYNFTATSDGIDTLTFQQNKTYTVANNLTLGNAAGDEKELFLTSSGTPNAIISNTGGTQTVNYVRVLKVDGTLADNIEADNSWDVDGTLQYWDFGPMLYTFVTTGNWSDAVNWEQNMLPRATDHILVDAGQTLTLDGNQTVVNVTINGTIDVNARDFVINGDLATGASGARTITTSSGSVDVDGVINATGGNVTFTHDDGVLIADSTVTSLGTLSFDFGTVKYNAPIAGQFIVADVYKHLQVSDVSAIKTLSGIVDIRGDLTIDTGVTTAMGDHNLTVTGATTIPGIVTINTATLDANGSFDASGGTITFTGAGDLQLGGAVVTSLGPNLTDNAGTVTYDFAGSQTIVEDAYNNLIAPGTGSGTKTLGGKVTVNGDLTIATGNTLVLGADTLDVTAGATAIAGDLTIGANGVLDADGTFTAAGGNIALTGTGSMELSGTVANLGTLNSAAGIVNYDGGTAQNILADTYYSLTASGAATKTLAGRVVLIGDLLIAAPSTAVLGGNTLKVGGAADIDGILTVAADSLIIAGASDFDGTLNITTGIIDTEGGFDAENGTIDFTGAGKLQLAGAVTHLGALSDDKGTVIYDGGNQDIFADTYYDLTASGTATKELGGVVVVERDLTIGAGVTLDVTSDDYALSIKRTFANSGTFDGKDGTVTFDGTDHQQLTSNGSTFNNLIFANTGGADKTLTIQDALDIDGNLTVTSGTFDISTNVNVALAGDLTIANLSVWTKGSGTLTFDGTTQAFSDGNGTPNNLGHISINQ